jgi:hypothetical protein
MPVFELAIGLERHTHNDHSQVVDFVRVVGVRPPVPANKEQRLLNYWKNVVIDHHSESIEVIFPERRVEGGSKRASNKDAIQKVTIGLKKILELDDNNGDVIKVINDKPVILQSTASVFEHLVDAA